MGGRGSGNWYRWSKKPTDENFHPFRVSRLKELGVIGLQKWQSGQWQWTCNDKVISTICYEVNTTDQEWPWIRVYYTNTNSKEQYDYKIRLTTTLPRYGGVRWWFLCPVKGCGKRVGVLYLAQVFACRHCNRMAYHSQNQTFDDRLSDKAFKIAQQLGHNGNVIDGFYGDKPKGMHWKTYQRKVAALEQATKGAMSGAFARFGDMF